MPNEGQVRDAGTPRYAPPCVLLTSAHMVSVDAIDAVREPE